VRFATFTETVVEIVYVPAATRIWSPGEAALMADCRSGWSAGTWIVAADAVAARTRPATAASQAGRLRLFMEGFLSFVSRPRRMDVRTE
jgi:hypothetical protein